MKKLLQSAFVLSMLVCAATALHAQQPTSGNTNSGCANSPEAPTDILMVVGAAGLFYGRNLLSKLRSK